MVELFRVMVSKSLKLKLREIYNCNKENSSVVVAKKISDGLLKETEKLQKWPESKPLLRMKKGESGTTRFPF